MGTYNNIITIPDSAPTGVGGTQIISSLKSLADGSYSIYENGINARTGQTVAVIQPGDSSIFCELPTGTATFLVEVSWVASSSSYGKFYLVVQNSAPVCGCGSGSLYVLGSGDIFIAPGISSPKEGVYGFANGLCYNGGCGSPSLAMVFHINWTMIA